MIDISRPLMAKIFDFDVGFVDEEGTGSIIRRVDSIEFPCQHHDNTVMWYSNGIKSESFEILPQEATK